MIYGIIGKKIGMTQVFSEDGVRVPVTAIQAGPCTVVEVKTPERHGYCAVTLGFGMTKRSSKPLMGRYEKAGLSPLKILKEFRMSEGDLSEQGSTVDVGIFQVGDHIHVKGITKGRGFQGVIKRWNFSGGDESHGCMSKRVPGSIGSSSDPSRVFKGKKLPGHMGAKTLTVKNLEVVGVDSERGVVLVKGSVPGSRNSYVFLKKSLPVDGRV